MSNRKGGGLEARVVLPIGRIGVALQPLADQLAALLRERSSLHADETPVRQLDPGSGKTKHAYLWAYRFSACISRPKRNHIG